MADQYGGIIDDARTLLEWKPILPLLKAWKDANDPTVKLRAAVQVARFVADVTDAGPKAAAAIRVADRIVGTMAVDPTLRSAIEELLR